MAPMSSLILVGVSAFSTTRTFAPSSAAVMAAIQPPVPQPTTSTSVSRVSVMSASATSGASPSQSETTGAASCTTTALPLAWEIQSATAFLTASEVTVAPETASTSTPWAFRMASWSLGAAAPPSSGVSPAASMMTSVISVSLKVMVTLTSLAMPLAVAE